MPPHASSVSNASTRPVQYSAVKPHSTSRISEKSVKTSKRLRFTEFWDKYWLYEVGACLVSLLFFIGIIVILKKFENRRLSDWPYNVTINTVISILATALGATLAVPISEGLGQLKWLWFRTPRTVADIETFDSATRGPLGAFQLIYKLRGLHLGILGSFITILALALSPFIQQVLNYETRDTILSQNATIPRSNRFNVLGGFFPMGQLVNTTTQAAVFNGIFNPDESAIQVSPSCSTGNCTFSEPYSSLAVCSSCVNITKFIQQNVYLVNNEGNKTFFYYNYTLPNGLTITDLSGEYINTTGSVNGNNTVWSGFAEPLNVVTVLSSTNDPIASPEEGFLIVGPWAAQCVLYVCVNTYTSVVNNGKLDEQIISTYSNESAQITSNGYNLTQQPCVDDLESGNSTYEVAELLGSDAEPGEATFSSCNYFVLPLVFLAIQDWLPSVFASAPPLSFDAVIYNNNIDNGNRSNFEFVDTVMARVAMSLTTNFRTYGDGPPAFGTSSTPETYIVIEWKWLILPAILVFLSIFFLLATMMSSRGIDAWKSSSLALLFSSGVIDDQDRIVKLHEIEWIAKGRCAILKETAAGNVQLSREID